MLPSNSGAEVYPQWLRCAGVTIALLSFPVLMLAACFGAEISLPMVVFGGLLSNRGFAVLCGVKDRSPALLSALDTGVRRLVQRHVPPGGIAMKYGRQRTNGPAERRAL